MRPGEALSRCRDYLRLSRLSAAHTRRPIRARRPDPAQCRQSRQCFLDELRFFPPSHHAHARHGNMAHAMRYHPAHSATASRIQPARSESVALVPAAKRRPTSGSSAGSSAHAIAGPGDAAPRRFFRALGGQLQWPGQVLDVAQRKGER